MKFELTKDHFKDIKKIDINSYNDFKPFQYKRLDTPVFFHSVLGMVNMGKFFYVVILDCLVVMRITKMYNNCSCLVYFSPISINNSIKKEQVVVGALLEAGFSIRMLKSELDRLGLSVNNKGIKPTIQYSGEFIYSVRDSVEMSGGKYKKLRKSVHLFDARGGQVSYTYGDTVDDFILSWATEKGVKSKYKHYIETLSKIDHSNLFFTTLYLNNEVQAFMVFERVGVYYHSVMGMVNHDAPFDMVPAWHYYSCKGLPDRDSYLNDGWGRGEGLYLQKKRLQPALIDDVYKIQAIGDIKNGYSLVEGFL